MAHISFSGFDIIIERKYINLKAGGFYMEGNREQERAELYRTIWNIATELRGSVDGWDFKSYVLGMLFYRYISENLTKYINDGEREGDPSFDYAEMADEEAMDAKESENSYKIKLLQNRTTNILTDYEDILNS